MLSTTLLSGLALLGATAQASPLSRRENDVLLKIPKGDGNATSSTLYGFMFEDINNSGDGGLYAELLSNRALQIVDVANQSTALYTWSAVNGSAFSAVNDTAPVSAALPNSFKLDLTNGQGSFENEGYWGIKVDSEWSYNVSFWAKCESPADVTISLVSNSTGSLAEASFPAITSEWTEYTTTIKPAKSASDVNNTFRVAVNGAAGSSIYFALFSLMPPTYKNRPNGMRIDIAEAIAAVEPSIWRFPGGNNLEGQTPDTRWRWNETIGPLSQRPGRMGDWTYQNTDGLGLLEYLHWLEDLDVEGIMGVYGGYSLRQISVNEEDFDWVIQEALDQIDFVLGDAATSPMAKLRADMGHPEPFTRVKYIEIGNEDFFAEESYQAYRWPLLQKAISDKYPDLPLMATTRPFTDLVPKEQYSDRHVYQTPKWFHQQANRYDNAPRPPFGPMIFEGEYAAISMNASDLYAPVSKNVGRLEYSTQMSACGEASYAIGFERNADLVFASAYAPMLQNANRAQWTPNMIVFDAGEVYPSISYYVQKMFSTHRSEIILPTTIQNGSTPYALNWVAGVNYERSLLFVKASNFGEETIPLALEFGADWNTKNATVEILKSDNATAWNKPNIENRVEPELTPVELYNGKLNYDMPPYSVAVFSVAF